MKKTTINTLLCLLAMFSSLANGDTLPFVGEGYPVLQETNGYQAALRAQAAQIEAEAQHVQGARLVIIPTMPISGNKKKEERFPKSGADCKSGAGVYEGSRFVGCNYE